MEYTSIYKNGKPAYFFIKIDAPEIRHETVILADKCINIQK